MDGYGGVRARGSGRFARQCAKREDFSLGAELDEKDVLSGARYHGVCQSYAAIMIPHL